MQIPVLSFGLRYNCRQVALSLLSAPRSRESGLKRVMGFFLEEKCSVRAEALLAVIKQAGCFFSYTCWECSVEEIAML